MIHGSPCVNADVGGKVDRRLVALLFLGHGQVLCRLTLKVLHAGHVHAGQLKAHPVSQHHHHGLVPALWNLQLAIQVAHVHDLARVPHHHLVEGVLRRWPQHNLALRDGAVEPELERLVGCEVLVGQVGVVVAVQARHGDLCAVVAKIQLSQAQGGPAVGPDAVVRHGLPVGNVGPDPLVVHHGDGPKINQGCPSHVV